MDAAQRRLVGAALQQTRKLLNTGQDEIARVLDMSRGNVSWIETGRSELTIDQIQRLAEFWEMPLLTLTERLGFPMDRSAPRFEDWYRTIRASVQHVTRASTSPASQDGDSGSDLSTPMGRKQSFRHLSMLSSGSPRFAPSLG